MPAGAIQTRAKRASAWMAPALGSNARRTSTATWPPISARPLLKHSGIRATRIPIVPPLSTVLRTGAPPGLLGAARAPAPKSACSRTTALRPPQAHKCARRRCRPSRRPAARTASATGATAGTGSARPRSATGPPVLMTQGARPATARATSAKRCPQMAKTAALALPAPMCATQPPSATALRRSAHSAWPRVTVATKTPHIANQDSSARTSATSAGPRTHSSATLVSRTTTVSPPSTA